jgi:hypothetical protein
MRRRSVSERTKKQCRADAGETADGIIQSAARFCNKMPAPGGLFTLRAVASWSAEHKKLL